MTIQWPKISLVTPSFRHARFLATTIESVLSQNYPNLEYVIVDGGSDDGTLDIIRRHEPHLHWWCSEPDGGHYDAVNKGFQHTTGEIMAWINSDDILLPWTLHAVGSIFAALPEVAWISSLEQTRIDYHGHCVGSGRIAGFSREAFLDGCYISHPGRRHWFLGCIQQESTFWRRSLWEAAGGSLRSAFSLAGDFDLWARFYRHAELFGVAAPLAGFRLCEHQRSSAADAYRGQSLASLAELAACVQGTQPGRRPRSLLSALGLPRHRRYEGRRVVRVDPERPQGRWAVERHAFRCRRAVQR